MTELVAINVLLGFKTCYNRLELLMDLTGMDKVQVSAVVAAGPTISTCNHPSIRGRRRLLLCVPILSLRDPTSSQVDRMACRLHRLKKSSLLVMVVEESVEETVQETVRGGLVDIEAADLIVKIESVGIMRMTDLLGVTSIANGEVVVVRHEMRGMEGGVGTRAKIEIGELTLIGEIWRSGVTRG